MKWLYWRNCTPTKGFKTAQEELGRSRHLKTGFNLRGSSWIHALNADVTSSQIYIKENLDRYDGVFLEKVNLISTIITPEGKQKKNLGQTTTELCRKVNSDVVIVASWDAWCPHPERICDEHKRSRIVDLCDLIVVLSNAWEAYKSMHPMMWNKVYDANKFVCLLAPFDTEYLSKLQKPYSKRLKHVMACGPVNYWQTNSHSAKVLKKCLPLDWKAGLSKVIRRPCPPPFYKLGRLKWWNYVDWVSKSYMGIMNAYTGGLCTIGGLGAVLKTPFVGSITADYIVECFPDLVRNYKDVDGQADLCKQLINEENFWREMTEKAYRICKQKFSFEGAKKLLYNELKKRDLL